MAVQVCVFLGRYCSWADKLSCGNGSSKNLPKGKCSLSMAG